METIFIENVSDLTASNKESLEAVLGCHLEPDQRIVIRVLEAGAKLDVSPDRAAMQRAAEIARRGRAAAEAQRITSEQANAVIDEAVAVARRTSR